MAEPRLGPTKPGARAYIGGVMDGPIPVVAPRPKGGRFAIRIINLATGGTTPLDGQWLVEYDPTRPGTGPNGEPMTAHIVCSPDPAGARRFVDVAAARAYAWAKSGRPYPADRPLTAYTVAVEEVPGV